MNSRCFKSRNDARAFTLAEVLITLGVIGVVAAMTIPQLVGNYQKTQYVAKLKKTYTILSEGAQLLAVDNNSPGDLSNIALTADEIAKYWKYVQRRDNTQTAEFFATRYKTFEGGYVSDGDINLPDCSGEHIIGYKYLLADGTALNIRAVGSWSCPADSICASIQVDINGAKPPNMTGRDFFNFGIMSNGTVYPAGGHKFGDSFSWQSTNMYNCTNPLQGDGTEMAYGCAGRIIEEGWQMNY